MKWRMTALSFPLCFHAMDGPETANKRMQMTALAERTQFSSRTKTRNFESVSCVVVKTGDGGGGGGGRRGAQAGWSGTGGSGSTKESGSAGASTGVVRGREWDGREGRVRDERGTREGQGRVTKGRWKVFCPPAGVGSDMSWWRLGPVTMGGAVAVGDMGGGSRRPAAGARRPSPDRLGSI